MRNTLIIIYCFFLITACGGRSNVVKSAAELSQNQGSQAFQSVDSINDSLRSTASSLDSSARRYLMGAGDVVNVLIYQAEDLSRDYQINSKGLIQIPVVGGIFVQGLTTDEAAEVVRKKLAETIMVDPQVTLSMVEYSSNQISVTGEVAAPQIFSLKQGRSPFEMLVMAGGLTKKAGRDMYITTKQINPSTKELSVARMIVELSPLFNPKTQGDFQNLEKVKRIILRDGDSIHVPAAGVVYIDGAIKSPGAYEMADDTTLLSLLALAGGAEWVASNKKIKVIRKIDDNNNQVYKLNLDRIRSNKDENFKLQAGDLVLVGSSAIKSGLKSFWEYGLAIILLL